MAAACSSVADELPGERTATVGEPTPAQQAADQGTEGVSTATPPSGDAAEGPTRTPVPSPTQTHAPSPAPVQPLPTSTQEAAQPTSPSDELAPLSTPPLEPLVTPISEEQYEKELDAFLFTLLHWKTNFRLRSVPFIGITAGGPPKDGIPAIDDPKFVSVEDADEWLDDREPVHVAELNGEVRAYPIQIMIWHEIANDALEASRSSSPIDPSATPPSCTGGRLKGGSSTSECPDCCASATSSCTTVRPSRGGSRPVGIPSSAI